MPFFDPNTVGDDVFEILRHGRYRVMITDASIKENAKKTGRYLQVKFQVMDGIGKGRTVSSFINFENANATAQNIGRSELKKLLAVVGHTTVVNSENDLGRILANKTLCIDVVESTYNGKPSNEVDGYTDAKGSPPASPQDTAENSRVPF